MWTDDVRIQGVRRSAGRDRGGAPGGRAPGVITLGIETSCDETAVAVVEDGFTVRANLIAAQVHLHERFGGVVPEVAARAHVEALNPLMAEALETAGLVGLRRPRRRRRHGRPGPRRGAPGRDGGGEGRLARHRRRLIGVNHLEGHIWANFLDARPARAAVRRARRERRPHDARAHARAVPLRGPRARRSTTRRARRSTRSRG